MDISDYVKVWAAQLVETLAQAKNHHVWYDQICDDLYVLHSGEPQPLEKIFTDLFFFSDKMALTSVGHGYDSTIATLDLMNDLIAHVMYRLEHCYGHDYTDIVSIARAFKQPVMSFN